MSGGGHDERAFEALAGQLRSLLAEAGEASSATCDADGKNDLAGEMRTMPLQASNANTFEELVQDQLARIGTQLETLARRLDEERAFAPQRPEEVPGYAELKTALHNLIEHLELAEGRTAEAIGALHERLEELSTRTAQALRLAQDGGADVPGESLKALEERIDALNARLEEMRQGDGTNARAYVDACIGEISRRIEQLEQAPAADQALEQDIARIVGEQMRAQAAQQARETEERMSALVQRLQGKLEDLSAGIMDVDRLRTDVERLEEQVRQVSARVDEKADAAQVRDVSERLDALAAQLREETRAAAPADDARLQELEQQVLQVRQLVEEALGEPLSVISDRLAAHEEQITRLQQAGGTGESADAQRLERLEQAMEQLQQALNDGGAGPGAGGDGDEIAALRAGLEDLRRFTRETDSKTREMIEAVHETLAMVVERLMALEEQGNAAGQTPPAASGAAAAVQPALTGVDALLGEPAPRQGAVAGPEEAREAPSASSSVSAEGDKATDASPRHDGATMPSGASLDDMAAEVARVAGTSQAGQSGHDAVSADALRAEVRTIAGNSGSADGVVPGHDAGCDSGQESARESAQVDDFIAAARRAALAAAMEQGGKEGGGKAAGSLLSRLGLFGGRGSRTAEPGSSESDSAATPRTTADEQAIAANDAGDTGGSGDASGQERRSVFNLTSLASFRKRGKDAAKATDTSADDDPTKAGDARRAGAGGAARSRLLLAGLVLLSAAVMIITRQPLPENTADTAPTTVESTPAPAGDTSTGSTASAPAPKAAPEESSTGAQRKEEQAETGGKPAPDKQASLGGGAPTGLFSPGMAGLPIHTASISPVARAASGAARKNGADASPASAPATGSVRAFGSVVPRRDVSGLPAGIGPVALRAAALEGDGKAAYVVALRYLKGGVGVPRDIAAGARWLRKAAEKGVVVAMYRLGMLYEQGLAVARDLPQARVWYERAALRGNVRAMHNLAVMLASGKLGQTDYDKAAYWFRKAATHGVRDSQFNLAVLYHRGQGVPQSLADAWFWYAAAARQGDADAAKQASAIAAYLPPARLQQMQQRLRDFSPTPPIRNANAVIIDRPEWQTREDTRQNGPRRAAATSSADAAGPDTQDRAPQGRELVAEVQRLLRSIGYDVGPVDGVMGNRTANAIRLFQMQSRLPVNGRPDATLLQRLRRHVGKG